MPISLQTPTHPRSFILIVLWQPKNLWGTFKREPTHINRQSRGRWKLAYLGPCTWVYIVGALLIRSSSGRSITLPLLHLSSGGLSRRKSLKLEFFISFHLQITPVSSLWVWRELPFLFTWRKLCWTTRAALMTSPICTYVCIDSVEQLFWLCVPIF